MNQIEKNSLLIVAGTALFMIMFGIGSIPLLDPDEPVYACLLYTSPSPRD